MANENMHVCHAADVCHFMRQSEFFHNRNFPLTCSSIVLFYGVFLFCFFWQQ